MSMLDFACWTVRVMVPALLCCSGQRAAPSATAELDGGAALAPSPEPAAAPAFEPAVRSLRLRRSIAVRAAPRGDSKRLGTVAKDTHVGWLRAVRGPECESRWIEIAPRGWVCEKYLEPSGQRPWGVELPALARDRLVPGVYGKIMTKGTSTYIVEGERMIASRRLAGSVTIRRLAERRAGGILYWKINSTEYVQAEGLREHEPSTFDGVRLGDDTGLSLPIGFVFAKRNPTHRLWSHKTPGGGPRVRQLLARTAVPVLDTARDEAGVAIWYRIGDDEWVSASELRIADRAPPPPVTLPLERWFDVVIDHDAQVLIAYEGELPVYATLISSGTAKHATQTGVFRIWIKFAETDMSGQMSDEETPYSVAKVPWTQFYAKDFALHAAYWHDGFGARRSHGCINLAPIDARLMYFWSEPNLPPGWSMAHGNVDYPGSMVRVRTAGEPNPPFVGYAERVYRARLAASVETGAASSASTPVSDL